MIKIKDQRYSLPFNAEYCAELGKIVKCATLPHCPEMSDVKMKLNDSAQGTSLFHYPTSGKCTKFARKFFFGTEVFVTAVDPHSPREVFLLWFPIFCSQSLVRNNILNSIMHFKEASSRCSPFSR